MSLNYQKLKVKRWVRINFEILTLCPKGSRRRNSSSRKKEDTGKSSRTPCLRRIKATCTLPMWRSATVNLRPMLASLPWPYQQGSISTSFRNPRKTLSLKKTASSLVSSCSSSMIQLRLSTSDRMASCYWQVRRQAASSFSSSTTSSSSDNTLASAIG